MTTKSQRIVQALLFSLTVGFTSNIVAQQFDAPYYELHKKHADAWAMEDSAIDAKLADLEAAFGKKPNIIYILTDDIGYGELGVQGGGGRLRAKDDQRPV